MLAADSQESLEVWMKALARASYDYLKLMVAELQKQLDELNGQHLGLDSLPLAKMQCSHVWCKGPPFIHTWMEFVMAEGWQIISKTLFEL